MRVKNAIGSLSNASPRGYFSLSERTKKKKKKKTKNKKQNTKKKLEQNIAQALKPTPRQDLGRDYDDVLSLFEDTEFTRPLLERCRSVCRYPDEYCPR